VSATNVAKVVSWLSSPESAGVNGQFIRVDNGWSHIRAI
jgi:enoyl-[acyl-carrier-protein] reductase (NADH)